MNVRRKVGKLRNRAKCLNNLDKCVKMGNVILKDVRIIRKFKMFN